CCRAVCSTLSPLPSCVHSTGFALFALLHPLLRLCPWQRQDRSVPWPLLGRPWFLPPWPLPQPFVCQRLEYLLALLLVLRGAGRTQRLPVGLQLLQRCFERDLSRRQRRLVGRSAAQPTGTLAHSWLQRCLGHHLAHQVVCQHVRPQFTLYRCRRFAREFP